MVAVLILSYCPVRSTYFPLCIELLFLNVATKINDDFSGTFLRTKMFSMKPCDKRQFGHQLRNEDIFVTRCEAIKRAEHKLLFQVPPADYFDGSDVGQTPPKISNGSQVCVHFILAKERRIFFVYVNGVLLNHRWFFLSFLFPKTNAIFVLCTTKNTFYYFRYVDTILPFG